jgi:hypothetical protein
MTDNASTDAQEGFQGGPAGAVGPEVRADASRLQAD